MDMDTVLHNLGVRDDTLSENEMSHLDHLMAVVSEVNRSKGAKDPAEWLPLDQFYWNESIHVWNG